MRRIAWLHGWHATTILSMVIQSFRDPVTEALFHGTPASRIRRVPPDVRPAAIRKLDMLNAAHPLEDFRSPPGNRLEALHGDLAGNHSIRVNAQWRIIFRWESSGPGDVGLIDYHR